MMRSGGLLKLSLASAMLIFVAMLPLVLAVNWDIAVFGTAEISVLWEHLVSVLPGYGSMFILDIFLVAPAFAAYVVYAYRMYSKARYGAVYGKKSSGGYFRCLLGGLLMTLRGAICALILQGAYVLTFHLEALFRIEELGIPMILLGIPLMSLAAVICLVLCWITGFAFTVPYCFAKGEGIFASFKRSFKSFIRHPFLKDGYALVFLGLIALSALTFGVLLIIFVMPLMMFTYFTLAEYIDGGELLED